MIKQDFYIANLIARYLSEEITPEETIKLTAWREESTAHEILFKKICNEENQKQHFRKNTAFNPSSGWKEVEKRIKRNNNRSRYIKIVSYAAIILLPVLFVSISMICLFMYYLIRLNKESEKKMERLNNTLLNRNENLKKIIEEKIESPDLGILGNERINVLKLNILLDKEF